MKIYNTISSITYLWYISRSGSTHFCNNIHQNNRSIFVTPEINMSSLYSCYFSCLHGHSVKKCINLFIKSKLPLNLLPNHRINFVNDLIRNKQYLSEFEFFILYVLDRYLIYSCQNQKISDIIIKCSNIDDFHSIFRLMNQRQRTQMNNKYNNKLNPSTRYSHILLIRHPWLISKSLNNTNKIKIPGLKMGWKGDLFVLDKLEKAINTFSYYNFQIIDFDRYAQGHALLVLGERNIKYQANMYPLKEYLISIPENSIHEKAKQLYFSPKSLMSEFDGSSFIHKINMMKFILLIYRHPIVSNMYDQHLNIFMDDKTLLFYLGFVLAIISHLRYFVSSAIILSWRFLPTKFMFNNFYIKYEKVDQSF